MIDAEQTKAALLGSLDAVRSHALSTVEGLDDAALRRRVLPSGWSCLGMIKHLVYDEEVFWFRAVTAGEPEAIALLQRPEIHASWDVPADADAAELIQTYRDEIARSNAIVAATPLDAAPAWWPGDLFGDWRLDTQQDILLHMITEVACHAGHLDAARELIDGHQFLVLTE